MFGIKNKKYLWFIVVAVILGLGIGYAILRLGLSNVVLNGGPSVKIEISNETDIVPINDGIEWLGLRIKTFISGEEKVAERDYVIQVEIPGMNGIYDLVLSRDEQNYILPLWPLSDAGAYNFLITTMENVGSKPFEYAVNYPGATLKESTYNLNNGKPTLIIEGVDLATIEDAYHVLGGFVEASPELSKSGGVFSVNLSEGLHIFVFRIGDGWYYTRTDVHLAF